MRTARIFMFAAAALAAVSCSSLTTARMELGADPMVDNVRQWTRTAKLYRQFDTTVLVDVTFNSSVLRMNTVEAQAQARRLGQQEKERLVAAEMEEDGKYIQFYLAMYTPESEWSEMAKKNPAWIAFVETADGPVFAETPKKIMQEEMPWGASLPYDPRFRSFYRINIPRKPVMKGQINLVLSSLLGEVRMNWNLP